MAFMWITVISNSSVVLLPDSSVALMVSGISFSPSCRLTV